MISIILNIVLSLAVIILVIVSIVLKRKKDKIIVNRKINIDTERKNSIMSCINSLNSIEINREISILDKIELIKFLATLHKCDNFEINLLYDKEEYQKTARKTINYLVAELNNQITYYSEVDPLFDVNYTFCIILRLLKK